MLLGLLDMKMLANNSTQACEICFKQVGSARIVINCEQFQSELPNKQKGQTNQCIEGHNAGDDFIKRCRQYIL